MRNDPLSELAMWTDWQERVRAALPNFAANTIYVEQDSPSAEEFNEVLLDLFERGVVTKDSTGMTRDAQYGARVVETPMGPLTRMWLDAQVEKDFIIRHLIAPCTGWDITVLDIGAGYGRLAVELAPRVADYLTVDPVPISVELCRKYCDRHAPQKVGVMDIAGFRKFKQDWSPGLVDLAINIHSWNECSLPNIQAWLMELAALRVPYLFTVSHGRPHLKEKTYYSWGKGQPSFRPFIEAEYDLVAEECIGLGKHPHALWKRR